MKTTQQTKRKQTKRSLFVKINGNIGGDSLKILQYLSYKTTHKDMNNAIAKLSNMWQGKILNNMTWF